MIETPEVFKTPSGTRYLKEPGVVLTAKTILTECAGLKEFLAGFEAGFEDYHDDLLNARDAGDATDGELNAQLAGQLCYMSFGAKRTPFEQNADYIVKILEAQHGSVLEHSFLTHLIYGADRAFTHELVRHRVGVGISQVSQRYVGPDILRFVMPHEDQRDSDLRLSFERHIDAVAEEYRQRIEALKVVMPQLDGERTTDWRKRIQSSARSVLSNDVEAPIYWTANYRALTHVFTMRCSRHADIRIRRPMLLVLEHAQDVAPNVFDHFKRYRLPDGTWEAVSKYSKP